MSCILIKKHRGKMILCNHCGPTNKLCWITVFLVHLPALVCWLEHIRPQGIWNCNKIRTSALCDLNMKWLDYWFWLFGSPTRGDTEAAQSPQMTFSTVFTYAVPIDCIKITTHTSCRSSLSHQFARSDGWSFSEMQQSRSLYEQITTLPFNQQ